jgi:hypothetical protein
MSKKNKNLNYNYNLELGNPIPTSLYKYIGTIDYDNYSVAFPYSTTPTGALTDDRGKCNDILHGNTRIVDENTNHPIEFTCGNADENGEYFVTTSGQSFQPDGYNCTYIGSNDGIKWTSDCSPRQGGDPPYNNFTTRATLSNGRGLCMADSWSRQPVTFDDCIISTYSANLRGIFPIGDDLFDIIKQKKLDYDTTNYVVKFGSGPNNINEFNKNSILTYINECNSIAVAYCSEQYQTDLCKQNYDNNTFRIKSSGTNKSGLSSLCHDLVIFSNTDSTNGVQGILEVDNDDNPTYVKLVPYTGEEPKKENIFTLHKHQDKNGLIDLVYYNSSKNVYIMQANTTTLPFPRDIYTINDLSQGTPFFWNYNNGPWGINLVSLDDTNPDQRFSKIQIIKNNKSLEWSIFNCFSSRKKCKYLGDPYIYTCKDLNKCLLDNDTFCAVK